MPTARAGARHGARRVLSSSARRGRPPATSSAKLLPTPDWQVPPQDPLARPDAGRWRRQGLTSWQCRPRRSVRLKLGSGRARGRARIPSCHPELARRLRGHGPCPPHSADGRPLYGRQVAGSLDDASCAAPRRPRQARRPRRRLIEVGNPVCS